MRKLVQVLVVAIAALALLAPTAALAQGGADSGGSGGGGGGGSTATTPCVKFGGWSSRIGYYKAWAAIWTSVNFSSSCYVTYSVTYTDDLTGAVYTLAQGGLLNAVYSSTIDADFLDFSTPYTVRLRIVDGSGAVQLEQTADITTPAPKTTP